MRQTLRQIVAVLALVAMSMNLVPSAFAAYTDVAAANKLAEASIINDFSANVAGYRLGDNLLRQEAIGVAGKASGIIPDAPVSDYVCMNKFSDVSEGWVCRAAELAAKAGITNAANSTFRPKDNLTRYEAMLFAFRGSCTDVESPTMTGVAEQAAAAGIISNAASFNGNAASTRGEFFRYVAAALDESECDPEDDNILCVFDPSFCDDEDTDPTTPVVGGDVSVELSSDSPDSATVPGSSSGIVVARFDFSASSSEDAVVTGVRLKRVGFGDTNTLTGLAIASSEGRLSKAKNENSSDDTVELNLTTPLVIKAGKTVTVDVLASVGTASAAGGDEFAIQLLDVSGSGTADIGDDTSDTMKVGTIDAAGITIDDDGTTPKVKVGETMKEVRRFKITNDASNEDISLDGITLKEIGTIDDMTEVANWTLFMDGTEVASVAKSSDKYITFNFDETATLKSGKTHKFVVKADITGGASKNINIDFDNTLDISAAGTKFGIGVAVTDSFTPAAVSVEAGELVLSVVEAPSDVIKENKKDVILGKIKVTSATGKNLELQKVAIQIATNDLSELVSDTFENVELYDETRGTVYDITTTGTGATESFADTDLNVSLPTGVTTFAIRADVKNLSGSTPTTLAEFAAATYSVSVPNIGGTGFYVVETMDDTVVSDITPSTLSFKTIEGSTAGATVTVLPLSTSKTAVIGSTDVEGLSFEIKADNSSALKFTEVQVASDIVDNSTVGAAILSNTRISEMKLYKDSISEANLLDRVSGSSLSNAGVATFDGFNVSIAKNATQKFVVTVSVVDDNNQALDTVRLKLSTTNPSVGVYIPVIDVDDEDGDDVTPNSYALAATAQSARTLAISGVGTLAAVVDNTDSETDKAKNTLGGTTTGFVASYELTAQNEGIKIKDLDVVGAGTNFVSAVSEIVLYKNDKTTEIARKSVSSLTTTFSDINYVVAQGSENIYVKVVTRKIGKDEAGLQTSDLTLSLDVTDADGASSNKTVITPALTSASLQFAVLPVRVSNVALVSSASGTSLASKFSNGTNNVAIIAVTTDSSSNTNTTSGASLKTQLSTVRVDVSKLSHASSVVGSLTIEKIGGSLTPIAGAVSSGSLGASSASAVVTFTTTGSDYDINNGSTVYYLVKALSVTNSSGSGLDKDDYIQVYFSGLNTATGSTAGIEYSDDDAGTTITDLRIGSLTKIDGIQINE